MRKTGSRFGILYIVFAVLLFVIMIGFTAYAIRCATANEQELESESEMFLELVSESETESSDMELEKKEVIRITNFGNYFSASLNNEDQFCECLSQHVRLKGYDATCGSIFHVSEISSEPDSMQYYVQLNDPMQSIIILTWHENEQVFTSSKCNFLREDVINECWNFSQPIMRDVSPEAEREFLLEQETIDLPDEVEELP